jgi:toxin CptA
MYCAPAVSYPVGRSVFYGQLLLGALLLGGFSLVVWIIQSDARAFRHLVAGVLWLGSAIVAVVVWLRSPRGLLTWDGQSWTWTGRGVSRLVVLRVMLDGQGTLLLHWREIGVSEGWVWLDRRTAQTRWQPLRRAVFAPQVASTTRDVDGVLP